MGDRARREKEWPFGAPPGRNRQSPNANSDVECAGRPEMRYACPVCAADPLRGPTKHPPLWHFIPCVHSVQCNCVGENNFFSYGDKDWRYCIIIHSSVGVFWRQDRRPHSEARTRKKKKWSPVYILFASWIRAHRH